MRASRAAFDWRGGSAAAAAARIDAWIDPPAYTGKPPILLDVSPSAGPAQKLVAPEGSILVVRAEASAIEARVEGALDAARGRQGRSRGERRRPRQRADRARAGRVRGDGAFTLLRDGSPFAAFDIAAIAAGKPTITLIDPPRANFSGSLTLHYALADRYGVAERRGGILQARRRRREPAAARADRSAEAAVAIAEHGERRRRGEHDQRSLRTSLGRRRSR